MLERLTVRGYRSLRDLHVELSPLTIIIGPNGCGKTNLYQSLQLLQAAAQGRLARSLATEGGVPSIAWAGSKRKDAPVRISVDVQFDDLDYLSPPT